MITAWTRYDSNFFKAEENERSVFTLLVAPGAEFKFETPKMMIRLALTLEAYLYEDLDSVPSGEREASDDNYLGPLGIIDLQYSPTRRLALGLANSYYITRDPSQSDQFSTAIDRRKYGINRLTASTFYDFENRFSIGARYRWTDITYFEGDVGDSTEHRGILNVLYNPRRTSTFDLEYQIWSQRYEVTEFQDYNSNQIKLIYQKRFKYWSFDGGIGWHYRDYQEPGVGSVDTLAYKFAALYQNPPPPEITQYRGEAIVRAKSHAYLALERNFNDLGANYRADRLTSSLSHVFKDKIRASLRGYFQRNDYIFTDREDDVWEFNIGIGYLITQKMEISAIGGRQERDSNVRGLSYTNNYALLRFDFNYDLGARAGYSEEGSYYR